MNTQTQSRISLCKQKRPSRFYMKRTKRNLKIVYKKDIKNTHKTNRDIPKAHNPAPNYYASTDTVREERIDQRPDVSYEQIMRQISPVKHATVGIKIA